MTPLAVYNPHPVRVPTGLPGDTVFSCQLNSTCYGPSQLRVAYNIQTLLDHGFTGAGKTIVIIDAFQSPTITQDLATFDAVFGLANPTLDIVAPDGLTPFDQSNADQTQWAGEITLDVEWAHAMAPGAKIVLVLSKSDADSDILSATKFAVDHRLGDVISQSFGELETCVDPTVVTKQHDVFVEATLKNITLFASSADQGAALPTCDGSSFTKGVSSPAVDPLVVAVGGTILTAAPECSPCTRPPGTYENEVVWNEPDYHAATGGGYSTLHNKPLYQFLAVRGGKRGVPDIAYNAAIIGGVLAVWSTSGQGANLVFQFGGTSAGSPQWAALTSILDQMAGHDVGFIHQGLYLLAADRHRYHTSFHDITVGDNTFHGASVTIPGYNAGPGWDPTTGLGSPNGEELVENLMRVVSPLDGLIGIWESAPLTTHVVTNSTHSRRPH
jgi:subtilase family serine protease